MAAGQPIKYSDLIIKDSDAIREAIRDLLELQKEHRKLDKDIKTQAESIKASLNGVSGATKKQQQTIAAANVETQKLIATKQQLDKAMNSNQERLVLLRQALADKNREAGLEIKLNNSATTSYNSLNAQLKLNIIALKNMTAEQRTNTAAGKALTAQTASLQKQLRAIQASITPATQAMSNMSSVSHGLTNQLRAVASAMGFAGIVYALVAVMKSALKTMIDYEKANAELAGVLGTTRKNTLLLQADSQRLGATTIKTAKEVTELQVSFARLGFSQRQIVEMTQATIEGSIAMNSSLDETATLVGAIIVAFDDLEATDTAEIVNKLTINTQETATNFSALATAIPKVAGAANALNISFNDMLANLGTAQNASLDASISGTSLRNIYLEIADAGLTLDQALDRINTSQNRVTAAVEMFDKRSAVVALGLANQRQETLALTYAQQKLGVSTAVAAEMMNTMSGEIALTRGAWQGFILSLETGEGVIATTMRAALEFFQDLFKSMTQLTDINSRLAKTNNNWWGGAVTDLQRIKNELIDVDGAMQRAFAGDVGIFTNKQIKNVIQDVANLNGVLQQVTKGTGVLNERHTEVFTFLNTKLADYISKTDQALLRDEDRTKLLGLLTAAQNKVTEALNRANIAEDEQLGYLPRLRKEIADLTKQLNDLNDVRSEEAIKLAALLKLKKQELIDLEKLLYDIDREPAARRGIVSALEDEIDALIIKRKYSKDRSEIATLNDTIKLKQEELNLLLGINQAKEKEKEIEDPNRDLFSAEVEHFQQLKDLADSEIELLKETEDQKTKMRLNAEASRLQAIIDINEKYGNQLSLLQIEQMKNLIKGIEQEIARIDAEQAKNPLYERLGFTNEEDFNRAVDNIFVIIDSLGMAADARVQAANAAVQASKEEVSAAQEYYDKQLEYRANGEANNVAAAERQLALAEETNKRAEKEAARAEKAQRKINEAQTLGSMILATANIFKGFSAIPFIGQLLAVAAVGSMFAAFTSAKASAAKAAKYGDGGSFDIGGGTHSSGNDTSLGVHGGVERKVERGEKVAVISAKTARRYGSDVDKIIASLNNGSFERDYAGSFTETNAPVVNDTAMLVEAIVASQATQLEVLKNDLKNIPRNNWSISNGGLKRDVRIGNTIYKDVKNNTRF